MSVRKCLKAARSGYLSRLTAVPDASGSRVQTEQEFRADSLQMPQQGGQKQRRAAHFHTLLENVQHSGGNTFPDGGPVIADNQFRAERSAHIDQPGDNKAVAAAGGQMAQKANIAD